MRNSAGQHLTDFLQAMSSVSAGAVPVVKIVVSLEVANQIAWGFASRIYTTADEFNQDLVVIRGVRIEAVP